VAGLEAVEHIPLQPELEQLVKATQVALEVVQQIMQGVAVAELVL
jgi:hypothetical protein